MHERPHVSQPEVRQPNRVERVPVLGRMLQDRDADLVVDWLDVATGTDRCWALTATADVSGHSELGAPNDASPLLSTLVVASLDGGPGPASAAFRAASTRHWIRISLSFVHLVRSPRALLLGTAVVAMPACVPDAGSKLEGLALPEASRAALARLRFARLHRGDRVVRGDVVICGEEDQVVIGFSRKLVAAYLGRDADWLMPELFTQQSGQEVLLDVPSGQVMRLELPRGIGSEVGHPVGWVREAAGSPIWSEDLRAINRLFSDDEVRELFALRTETALPAPVATPRSEPWRLGVSVYPRMGPRSGVMIAEVIGGSPAERAGLRKGDRILAVGDLEVRTFRELKAATQRSAGPLILLQILKAGAEQPQSLAVNVDPAD
jgi:hypothetical protein